MYSIYENHSPRRARLSVMHVHLSNWMSWLVYWAFCIFVSQLHFVGVLLTRSIIAIIIIIINWKDGAAKATLEIPSIWEHSQSDLPKWNELTDLKVLLTGLHQQGYAVHLPRPVTISHTCRWDICVWVHWVTRPEGISNWAPHARLCFYQNLLPYQQ